LFKAQFGAELRGVASVDPAQIVGNDVAALLFDGGLVPGAANRRRAITKADRGEAAELGTERNSGKAQLLRDVNVVIQLVTVGMQTIETEAEFVDEVVIKTVNLAGSQALCRVLAVAVLKAAAIERVVEGRGQEGAVVAVAEAGEEIVFWLSV